MKKLTLLLALFLCFNLYAQDDNGYVMFETILLKPDTKMFKEFGEKMKAHNQKYHSKAPFNATVWSIATGPQAGQVVWMMGPCTFTDLDSRPSAGGHDDDWTQNVLPTCKGMHSGEYWRLQTNLSHIPEGAEDDGPAPIVQVRFRNVTKGQGHRVDGLMKRIQAVVKSMNREWTVYTNLFQQGYEIGRHIAAVTPMKNWAELDEDPKFRAEYEKIHGDNSWDGFLTEMGEVFSNSWDEYWTYLPELSTPSSGTD